jgi:probable phosphoglycerate mutase
LSDEGVEQAQRLPEALKRFPIKRLVSSPQVRSVQTAQPVADALELTIEIDERLAEYDRDMAHYIPIEQIAAEFPEELERLASGHLPSSVDETVFLGRINAAVRDLVTSSDHEDTVAVFSHGGVINGLLHTILGTEKILCFNVDYAGVTRLLSSREGNLYVAAVNGTEHVWDLLPRNQRW